MYFRVRIAHLKLGAHNGVTVDLPGDAIDQVYKEFGHVVTRSGFSTNHDGSCYHVDTRVLPDLVVQSDHVQYIQKLPFVLMDTFDLTLMQK